MLGPLTTPISVRAKRLVNFAKSFLLLFFGIGVKRIQNKIRHVGRSPLLQSTFLFGRHKQMLTPPFRLVKLSIFRGTNDPVETARLSAFLF